jgi:surface antigen
VEVEWKGMRRMKLKIAAAIAALALSACSTSGTDRGGAATQAFADAARPHNGAAIVEAMAGGLVAGPVGTGLDARDRRRALEAEYRALEHTPAGQKVAWGRPGDRGGHGEVVAGSPYRVGSQDCRQYSHTVSIDGRAQTARGAACRNPDGSWTPLV